MHSLTRSVGSAKCKLTKLCQKENELLQEDSNVHQVAQDTRA